MSNTPSYTDTNYPVVERCKKGDKKAFQELYTLYAKAMFNASVRILNNHEEAQEVLQDSFLKAFQSINTFNKNYSFGTWLKRIVVNRSLDVLKKRKVVFIAIDDVDYAAEQDVDIEEEEVHYDVEAIKQCMVKLPDGFRTILSLYLFEEYSHKEIAVLLNISEGTSKSQYSRGKKKLIELIKYNTVTHGR